MSNEKKFTGINIETLLLVAVWNNPFVFQGCFKITELGRDNRVLFFFRCQSNHGQQTDILNHDFSPDHYEFTHLYDESGLIQLNNLDQIEEDALYLLKYALHRTLGEMSLNRKMHFTSIDDIAMQALIDKVRPILNKELRLPEEEHLGFAIAMDFYPEDKMTLLAALALLGKLKNLNANTIQSH